LLSIKRVALIGALPLVVCFAAGTDSNTKQPATSDHNSATPLRSACMCEELLSADNLAGLEALLDGVINSVRTVDELANWLRSQPCVKAVKIADHLVKTEPPQKEVSVLFKMSDGSVIAKVIDIRLNADQSIGLAGAHDP
jgi:hypothetical protein